MDTFETIRTMLAVRRYQDKPVPDATLRRVVEAGRLTGSAKNLQPWHFIVVRDKKTLQKLGMLLVQRKLYDEAEAVLTQAVRREPKGAPAYFNLGQVYAGKKRYKVAIENYQKFLELAPKGDPDRDRASAAIKELKRK